MMIKFRVWNTRSEKMRPVDTLYFQNGEIAFVEVLTDEVSDWDGKPKGYSKFSIHNEDNVLMQSTGLKDKNGVEIFEGDILYFEPYKTHSNDRVVEHIDGAYHGRLIRNGYSKLLAECVYETKVIGNIWRNPELLEVAE